MNGLHPSPFPPRAWTITGWLRRGTWQTGQLSPGQGLDTVGNILFAVFWTTVCFALVALAVLPFGQLMAGALEALPNRLRGYSINLAGSLLGSLLFNGVSAAGLPPALWFVPVLLALVWMTPAGHLRGPLVPLALLALLTLAPDDTAQHQDVWSSYQKLTIQDGRVILVNNVSYQSMERQPVLSQGQPATVGRFTLPYTLRSPPGDVLVVGAGSGNDVAAALGAGASHVTAVDIDPMIYRIGQQLHPQQPYADPRVEVVIDDARHFFKEATRKFDLVVFSHLDAHTVLSGHTNVRLDNYVYTLESFRDAYALLKPGGVMYVTFFSEQEFLAARLARNLELALGRAPVCLLERGAVERGLARKSLYFLVGTPEVPPCWNSGPAPARRCCAWTTPRPPCSPPPIIGPTSAWTVRRFRRSSWW